MTMTKDEFYWHDAQSDDLPPIDEEVIVLDIRGKVFFGHRPDPKGWIGKPISYGKGGWNFPDVRWWMPCPQIPEEDKQ